ncbi:MAG TPA: ATP-dependent Clp protease ATP-binding subunit ClpC, partial [Bacillota bacterium]|nr:ATP-dependent Clp protease ATP-binding subunit ClpC [Bacillota bacterium]
HTFNPEFLNRIDETIVFHPLDKQHIKDIAQVMLSALGRRLESSGFSLSVTEAAKDILVEQGYDQVFGARPMRRIIQRLVEDQLSEALLRGMFTTGDTIWIDGVDGSIQIRDLPA